MGRGPGPLRANRDRTPPNASLDSLRCESIGSEHRRCLAKEATFVGIEHGMRDARNDRPSTPGYSSGSSSAPSNGTNARTTTCVWSSGSSRSSGRNRRWRHARRRRHRRRACTSRFTGRCWGRTAPSTSITSSPSPAPSASMPSGSRATWRPPALDGLIERNAAVTNALGVRGTPAFVIGVVERPLLTFRNVARSMDTAYAHGSGCESLPPDVEVGVRAGERVECSLYVPADGATT